MSEKAKRDNSGKPQLSFILQFPTAVAAHARVKELGAIKYERDNWKKGGKPDHEYLDACLRHISSFMEGETFADDTGCSHLAHAMWNIMALQDLNYPGVVYDKELFDNMCEYWRDRREAEAKGFKFPSVEDWMNGNRELDMNDVRGDGTTIGPAYHDDGPEEEDGPWADGYEERTRLLNDVIDFTDDADEAARSAAARLLETILPPEPKALSKLDFRAPGVAEVFDFDEPLTVKNGETLNFDLSARKAEVRNEVGEVLATTGLTITETSEFVTPTIDPVEPLPGSGEYTVYTYDEIDAAIANPNFQLSDLKGMQTVNDDGSYTDGYKYLLTGSRMKAAEELSAVMGTSVEQCVLDLERAESAFFLAGDSDPLMDLFQGNVTTTVDSGELFNAEKTDRSVEELREEARQNIEKHTALCQKEKAAEDARERENAAYREGREAGVTIRKGVLEAAKEQAYRMGQQAALASLNVAVNGIQEEDDEDDSWIDSDIDRGYDDFGL